jgi:hypothetical protein
MASYPYSKRRKRRNPLNLFIDIGCETKEEVDKMVQDASSLSQMNS